MTTRDVDPPANPPADPVIASYLVRVHVRGHGDPLTNDVLEATVAAAVEAAGPVSRADRPLWRVTAQSERTDI